jgi:hypothetical protein
MLSLQFQKSSSRSFHFLAVRCSRISWTDADALIDNDVVLQKVGRQKVDFKSKEVGNTINAMKTGCTVLDTERRFIGEIGACLHSRLFSWPQRLVQPSPLRALGGAARAEQAASFFFRGENSRIRTLRTIIVFQIWFSRPNDWPINSLQSHALYVTHI